MQKKGAFCVVEKCWKTAYALTLSVFVAHQCQEQLLLKH